MKAVNELRIKIFGDGADKATMLELSRNPLIRGFTTNPTLMRKAGISDYRGFAQDVLAAIPDKPISFEVFSDDFEEMKDQALEIASWGTNVYVKIPVTNTQGLSSAPLVAALSSHRVQVNVTAIFTLEQVREIMPCLAPNVCSCVSIFAGRIADTGRDPVPIMQKAMQLLSVNPAVELIWASPRELLNVFQADEIGCHVITVTQDVLNKLKVVGKDLTEYSLETVRMFYDDSVKAGYKFSPPSPALPSPQGTLGQPL